MSNDVRYVLLKLYISNSINDIENVFNQTKHNYSPFQCEKMEEALIEARSLLAEIISIGLLKLKFPFQL